MLAPDLMIHSKVLRAASSSHFADNKHPKPSTTQVFLEGPTDFQSTRSGSMRFTESSWRLHSKAHKSSVWSIFYQLGNQRTSTWVRLRFATFDFFCASQSPLISEKKSTGIHPQQHPVQVFSCLEALLEAKMRHPQDVVVFCHRYDMSHQNPKLMIKLYASITKTPNQPSPPRTHMLHFSKLLSDLLRMFKHLGTLWPWVNKNQ